MMLLKQCDVCGLTYGSDLAIHRAKHREWLTLSDAFAVADYGPFLWAYGRREEEKRSAWPAANDKTLPLAVRADAAKRILYAHFCRAIQEQAALKQAASFKDFAKYCASEIDTHDIFPGLFR